MGKAFADWIVDMIDIHLRYWYDQTITLAKAAWIELQLMWVKVKIVWYS